MLDNEITFPILVVFSVCTPVWHSGHQHASWIRFIWNHLPNLQMRFTVTLIIINSIYEGGFTWRFSEYLSIHWDVSQTQVVVVTILRARAKQEEPYLEYHSRRWWRYSQRVSTHIWGRGADDFKDNIYWFVEIWPFVVDPCNFVM